MAESTGLALSVGGVTLANLMVLNPMAQGKGIDVSQGWRVIPATAIFALMLAGIEQLPGPSSKIFAKGLAGIALITVVFTSPVKGTNSPVKNLASIAKVGGY
jgi:ABC-type Fe3+-siderophore transport system permease subunit